MSATTPLQITGVGSSNTMEAQVLRRLQSIETVGASEPYVIVPVFPAQGTVVTPEEAMVAKVKWAMKAGYSVLTWDVPDEFTPYNAIIRVSETGTEDRMRDYLAYLAEVPRD